MAELSDAAEKVGEAANLGAEAVEEVVEVIHNHISWFWLGWGSGVALGLGGGFLAARQYLEPKYEKVAENEIDQMREHFRQRMVAREKLRDKPDLVDLDKKMEILGYQGEKGPIVATPDPPAPGEPNVQRDPGADAETLRNVFRSEKNASEGWDYEVEKALRQEGGTYVIHRDETGETDNAEMTLSYYAGDDVLCDQNDRIVDNPERLVGDCLEKFGHGSNDRNVVYVRNEALAVDLEVIKSDKTYAEDVHGLKHEDPPRKRIPYQD